MGDLEGIHVWLVERFGELLAAHQVPGAAVAVLSNDEVVEAAAGVLNRSTGVEATNDSVFQIGSITKTWTGTLIMQLVDEGKLDLDKPVRTYLPDFRVADESASATVTPRQLLCHVGGFEGDLFVETTRGDDAVERFVADVLPETPQVFAPGESYSYCNSGFVVLGRLLEVLRGKPFRQVVHDHLATPLGLTQVAANADEAILHRAAVGHLGPDPDGKRVPASVWSFQHSNAPAGAMLAMAARDLLGFARLHLRDGLAPDGTRLLSEASTRAMREPQVDEPPVTNVRTRRGLAWTLPEWPGGTTVIGHNGETVGQRAYLRVLPEHDIAVALLTNGYSPYRMCHEVFGHVLGELADIQLPPVPEPPELPEPVDPARYVGTYESKLRRLEIEPDEDGGLWCTATLLGEIAEMLQAGPQRTKYVRLDGDTFIMAEDEGDGHATFAFVGADDQDRASFLHNNRAHPRVSD